jgi:hypothetical protein
LFFDKYSPFVSLAVLLEVFIERRRDICQRYVWHLEIHFQQAIALVDNALQNGNQESVAVLVFEKKKRIVDVDE